MPRLPVADTRVASETIGAERHVASTLARVSAVSHLSVVHVLSHTHAAIERLISVVRVKNLLNRYSAQNLEVHEREEV